MRYFSLIISAFVLLSLKMPARAQQVYRLTLSKAVEMARKENTKVRNANYDIDIARKKVWETTSIGLPQVSTSLSYKNNIDLPVTLVPAKIFNPQAGDDEFMELKFGVQHNVMLNLQVNQLIFNGSYIVGLKTSKIFKQMAEENKIKTENDVVAQTTQTYNTILFSLKNKGILEHTLDDIAKTYEELKATYKAGLAEETAVDQILLNKLTVENAIRSIDRQITVQLNLLKIQMGVDFNDSLVINDSLDLVFENAHVEKALYQDFDMSKNPDYMVMSTKEKIDEKQVSLAKMSLLPSVNAFFSHNQSGQSDDFTFFNSDQKWFPSNVIGASLVIPITTSGGNIAKIKEAELNLRKTQNNKKLLEQNLLLSVSTARNKLIKEYETYLTQKQNVVLAEKIYKRSLVKFKQGMISSAELTQVNTQYYNSQSLYYAAILNVLNAKAALDKILGNNF